MTVRKCYEPNIETSSYLLSFSSPATYDKNDNIRVRKYFEQNIKLNSVCSED